MGSLTSGVPLIYESPDGGKTVFAREMGSNEKKLVGYQLDLFEDINWYEVTSLARSNPALRQALDHAILIYNLSKDHGT